MFWYRNIDHGAVFGRVGDVESSLLFTTRRSHKSEGIPSVLPQSWHLFRHNRGVGSATVVASVPKIIHKKVVKIFCVSCWPVICWHSILHGVLEKIIHKKVVERFCVCSLLLALD